MKRPDTLLERLPRSVFVWTGLFFLFATYAFFVAPILLVLIVAGLDDDRRISARLAAAGFRGFLTWCTWVGLARVRGHVPRRGGFVIVSNHESGLDSCLLLAFSPRPTRLVSKAGNWKLPMVGLAVWSSGAIFLPENDERSIGGADVLAEAVRSVQRGVSVAFFAEGSRSRGRGIRRFRKGAFEVAAATGAPVLPVVIVGSGEFMPPGVHPLGPYRITVEFLPPRRVEGDPDEFRRALRAEVARRHDEILAEEFHAPTRAERTRLPTAMPAVESRERTFTESA